MAVTQRGVGDVVDDGKDDRRGGERESVRAAAAVEKDDAGKRAEKDRCVHDEDGALKPEIGAEEVGDGALGAEPSGDDASEQEF